MNGIVTSQFNHNRFQSSTIFNYFIFEPDYHNHWQEKIIVIFFFVVDLKFSKNNPSLVGQHDDIGAF
jgi:hypothetical protein